MTERRTYNEDLARWHLKLFSKSLTKKAKWRRIRKMLGPVNDGIGLDIGSDSGVISYLLRQRGGEWYSVDADPVAVESIRSLVGDQVYLMEDASLPFNDESFDVIVIVDMLEHLEQDHAFVRECHRVLKPSGRLIVNVPHYKRFSALRGLRLLVGLTDAEHGHVRPGYTAPQLFSLLKDGFDVQEIETYSRFFVELGDTFIRLGTKLMDRSGRAGKKGRIVDEQLMRSLGKAFRAYAVVYPALWLVAQLDHLLFFTRGHMLIARTRRRMWIPRKIPVLNDGRSIADAAINTRIGSALPY
jgi:SAM-dependent methyltransferase